MTDNKPTPGEFYALLVDTRDPDKSHGVEFENLKELLTPPRRGLRPYDGGIPPLRDTPRLIYHPNEGNMPRDLESSFGGYWLASQRLKDVLEREDPVGVVFAECDLRLPDGTQGPPHYLFDVVRVLDAVDEDASHMQIEVGDQFVKGKVYNFMGGANLAFRKDVIGCAHIFRLPFALGPVFLDRVLFDALEEDGLLREDNSTGLWLTDAATWAEVA